MSGIRMDWQFGLVASVAAVVLFTAGASPALAAGSSLADRAVELIDVTGLFLVGLLLILAEVFIVPGHGFAGIPGVMLIGWSLFITYQRFGLETGLTVAAIQMTISGAATVAIFKVFPRTPAGRALVHNKQLDAVIEPESHALREEDWAGRSGQAVSDLRPAGSARFGERTLDVTCEDGYLERGATIEIVRFDEGRVIVRRAR